MSIKSNLLQLKSKLPAAVTLVAVSKTKPVSDLMQAYEAGQRLFGENKVQEMVLKYEQMPKDIEWHMIGHVQSNKVRHMAPFVSLIHGVDNLKLLEEIDRQAAKHSRVIRCLLQVCISQEDTKFGLSPQELRALLGSDTIQQLKNVAIEGLMGMASFTEDQEQLRKEFNGLQQLFAECQLAHPQFTTLSMGMSGDYEVAIACGSTMIRIGSTIFGSR